jgi:hypothetical protein
LSGTVPGFELSPASYAYAQEFLTFNTRPVSRRRCWGCDVGIFAALIGGLFHAGLVANILSRCLKSKGTSDRSKSIRATSGSREICWVDCPAFSTTCRPAGQHAHKT